MTRYILKDILTMFAITLGGMTLLMVLVGIAQEAVRQGLGLGPILRLIPYMLPNALRFAAPGAVLFSACSVYGRMSSSNEITAIKSFGISPRATVTPVLAVGFVLSLTTVWLSDVAVTWGREGVHRVVIQSVEQIAYGMLKSQKSYATNKFSVSVQDVEGRKLIGPTFVIQGNKDSEPITLTAREAEIRSVPERGTLLFVMREGTMDVGNDASLIFRDKIEHEVPLSEASNRNEDSNGPSQVSLGGIPQAVIDQQTEIDKMEEMIAAETAADLLLGNHSALHDSKWRKQTSKLDVGRYRLCRLKAEPWRRWATGFTCLFFVWVGAPLAIRLRNADLWTSFGICFLPILLVYYPLLAFGVDQAKSGDLPPYCVWTGNLILFLAGAWLMRKIVRY